MYMYNACILTKRIMHVHGVIVISCRLKCETHHKLIYIIQSYYYYETVYRSVCTALIKHFVIDNLCFGWRVRVIKLKNVRSLVFVAVVAKDQIYRTVSLCHRQ